MGSGKFPGYMVTHRRIEVNRNQIKAINNLQPSRNPKERTDYTGRVAKWGMILRALDIKYMPRVSVKGQVLVDLVAKFAESPIEREEEEQNIDGKSVGVVSLQESLTWRVYVDGTANQRGSGVGLVVISPEKNIIEKSLRFWFLATNNEAEYEALLVGMDMVQKMGGATVEVFLDLRLVIGKVNGELEARDSRMQGYLSQARHLQSRFKSFTLQQILRSRNTH
ncbi:uncharacterized protein LOC142605921 [Castanea sativa]|uniref:uncharacterized protein LOC142605921 n=1 Tax=Castanea sativa TaxID=21020 RepID=UPI003F64F2D4